ncbi:MAG: hypothetical protein OXG58_04020 [Gemmatimonadetes bacterium]|nr:hypothetical protein [Gemmatimonadota bacterium]MCY3943748.1 hypothetical protein [Gemmatimonadota bacterium]
MDPALAALGTLLGIGFVRFTHMVSGTQDFDLDSVGGRGTSPGP